MAIQNKSDMSMNEILKSIKNFVSVGEVKAERSAEGSRAAPPAARADVSPFGAQEVPVIDEDRPLSTEEKMRLLEELNMPEFMRRGMERNEQNEPVEEDPSHLAVSDSVNVNRRSPGSSLNSSELGDEHELPRGRMFQTQDSSSVRPERSGAKVAFQHFADTVEGLVHPKPALQGGLDQMMRQAIQMSVDAWLDQHMQAIVEDLVQREIAKITEAILDKPQANSRDPF